MEVLCGQCGRELQVDDAQAGTHVICPHCSHPIRVPRLDGQGSPGPALPHDEADGFADQARAAMDRKVRIVCGKCGRGLSVGIRMAGKKTHCPACQASIQVPATEEEQRILEHLRRLEPAEGEDEAIVIEAPPEATEPPPPEPQPEFRNSPAIALMRRRIRRDALLLAAIVVLALGAVIAVVVALSSRHGETPPTHAGVPIPTPSPTATPPTPSPSPTPTPSPTPNPNPSPTAPTSPANELICLTSVDSVRADYFAIDGYYPAKPGYVYWLVAVSLGVQSGQADLKTAGPDVVIEASGDAGKAVVPSLGLRDTAATLPVRAKPAVLSLRKQDKPFEATFVFEVPENLAAGKIVLRGVDEIDLPAPHRPALALPRNLLGKFVEAPPRNLKPQLRDPVMAAIQADTAGRLIVTGREPDFQVSIPSAGITGTARYTSGDLFAAKLTTADGQSLDCRIRALGDGSQLVLYLSDEPFHQVTYQRR